MDLRQYKYIKNTKPQFYGGKSTFSPKTLFPKITGEVLGNSIVPTIGTIGNLTLAFGATKSVDLILNEGGTSLANVNGVSYEIFNPVDELAQLEELKALNASNALKTVSSAASLGGTIGGPIGAGIGAVVGGIGSLFGARKRRRELRRKLEEAKLLNARTNNFNRAGANSLYLQQEWAQNNLNNTDDILYANKGKDMNKVWTPNGYQVGPTNSLVGKGESIIDYTNGTGILVTKGTVGKDDQPSSVHMNDNNVILGNDVDWTNGKKFSDQAAPFTASLEALNKVLNKAGRYGNRSSLSNVTKNVQEREINKRRQPILDQLGNISSRQEILHQIENKLATQRFAGGKDLLGNPVTLPTDAIFNWFTPTNTVNQVSNEKINIKPIKTPMDINNRGRNKFLSDFASTTQRLFPSIFGISSALGQYGRYANESITPTNTYRNNPYASQALSGLASLRYNINPELRAIRDAERRGAYAINNAGGMSGGQRYLARIANTLGTQANLANTYANADAQNNKYRATYYDALLNAGQADRAAGMSAAQQDYENYVNAHGAKYTNMDRATANIINQVNNAYANEFKYNTWKNTLRLYNQELTDEQLALMNNALGRTRS